MTVPDKEGLREAIADVLQRAVDDGGWIRYDGAPVLGWQPTDAVLAMPEMQAIRYVLDVCTIDPQGGYIHPSWGLPQSVIDWVLAEPRATVPPTSGATDE